MPTFDAIPRVSQARYQVDVSWRFLPKWIQEHQNEYGLDLDPDFQRGHVWTQQQQARYVEHILQGGVSGLNIYTNCPRWEYMNNIGPYVVVDGKQRITAVLAFLDNQFRIFEGEPYGGFHGDYTNKLSYIGPSFKWHVHNLNTRSEVLRWYLALNNGGVVHTEEELNRVRKLLKAEDKG